MSSTSSSRQFLPSLSELIDRLTVTQVKLNLLVENSEDFSSEVTKLINYINLF